MQRKPTRNTKCMCLTSKLAVHFVCEGVMMINVLIYFVEFGVLFDVLRMSHLLRPYKAN